MRSNLVFLSLADHLAITANTTPVQYSKCVTMDEGPTVMAE